MSWEEPTGPPAANSRGPSKGIPRLRRRRSSAVVIAAIAVVIVVIATLAVGYEQGWFATRSTSTSTAACPTGLTLQGNGAQFVNPLMSQWEPLFSMSSGNSINYPADGSGTGISEFNGTTVDFAVTDEPLDSMQTSALPSPALTFPIVGGALAIIYNLPGVTKQLNLTGAVLAGIYLGTITTWNSEPIQTLNPGVTLPAETIYTVHRSDPAGTTYVLTNFLSEDNATWNTTVGQGISVMFPNAPKQIAEKGNSAVLHEVESTDYTIGYSDLTDVLTASSPPGYAAVENPSHQFVSPTIASTASAIADKLARIALPSSAGNWYGVSLVNAPGPTDYPLATFVFLFVYKALDKGFTPSLVKSQVMVQWLDWVVSPAAQALADHTSGATPLYYVPLPNPVVTVDQQGISSLTYDGSAVPACTTG
jgi:phosphate transport system substrate-binding protein